MEGPPRENGGENNTSNSTGEDPPIVPPGEAPARKRKRSNEPKEAPDWKPERFAAFWEAYPCGKSKQAAIRAWDKLKPDDALIREMALGLKRAMEWRSGSGALESRMPPPGSMAAAGRTRTSPFRRGLRTSRDPARPCHVEMIDGEEVVVYDG